MIQSASQTGFQVIKLDRSSYFRTGQVCMEWVNLCRDKSSQLRTGLVKAGQIKSIWDRLGKERSSLVRSNKESQVNTCHVRKSQGGFVKHIALKENFALKY